MKNLIIFLTLLSSLCFAQKSDVVRVEWPTGSTTGAGYLDDDTDTYVVLTNADTVISERINMSRMFTGAIRVTAIFDTVSGSGNKLFAEVGIKVAQFSNSTANWVYTVLDSFQIADDNKAQTYQIQKDYTFFEAPAINLVLRVRQTGTQKNKIGFDIIKQSN